MEQWRVVCGEETKWGDAIWASLRLRPRGILLLFFLVFVFLFIFATRLLRLGLRRPQGLDLPLLSASTLHSGTARRRGSDVSNLTFLPPALPRDWSVLSHNLSSIHIHSIFFTR